jgi:hypothetical protein
MMRNVPEKYRQMYAKRKKSRKSAIRFMCLECLGFSEDEVRQCSDTSCSLFSWRLKG